KQLYKTEKIAQAPNEGLHKEVQLQQNITTKAFFGNSLGCLIPNYLMSQTLSAEGHTQIFVIHIIRAQQFLLMQLFRPGRQTPLLIPETVSLTNSEIESLLKYQTELHQWGLELSQLGDDTLMLRSLPSLYDIPGCTIDTESLIKGVLLHIKGSFPAEGSSPVKDSELMAALINSLRSAVLSLSEQEILLKMLSEQMNQSTVELASIGQKAVWKILDEAKLDHLF
ncbi:MAG: hypothetical protein KAI22_06930, partial [Gammaproteobacteria bacterium]|nr:hypothetical protein [Gammaproteobacteria bacterium]